ATARLCAYLESSPEISLADIAHTTRVGRRAFTHRRYAVAATHEDAVKLLRSPNPTRAGTREVGADLPDVAFLAPGQGSQYARMGHGLYESEPAFREAYDACCKILGGDFKERFFASEASSLTATSLTQPAIFTLEYSLARLWMSWGVKPTALIGHSVGEFVCAVIAGVMSLEDAIDLVRERGALMQSLPEGSMLSVRLPAAELEPRLHDGVGIAAENGPSLCVAAGPTPAIEALQRVLEAEGVVSKRLVTSHAFHSSMMDPVVEPFATRAAKVKLSPPQIPIVSTVTGELLTDEQATSPRYWAEHLRKPVRFAPAVAKLLADSPRRVLVEIGPRATLSALARQAVTGKRALPVAIPSLADTPEQESDTASAALGQLWALGFSADFAAYAAHERRHRVALPTYPFEHQRHWVDAARPVEPKSASAVSLQEPPMSAPVQAAAPVVRAPLSGGRRDRLIAQVCELVEEVSGTEIAGSDPNTPWLDLGLDSLTLTQLALQIGRALGVKTSLRQILEQYTTVGLLAAMLDEKLPPETVEAEPAPMPVPVAQVRVAMPVATGAPTPYLQAIIDQQLQLMQQQLALLGGAPALAPALAHAPAPALAPAPPPAPAPVLEKRAPNEDDAPAGPQTYDVKKAFGAIARIHTKADELTPHQRARLDAFMKRYNERTKKSKEYTQKHRGHMADPRVVNGFRPLTKEITYQIVIERSRGSRVWDIDGNEYVDILNGFGMNMFGWQPDFLRKAVHDQTELGYEIGPQHVLSGEVAELFCELTGADRAAFCNTGSEAVMGCMRIARTVTGRSLIVVFTGGYHGIFDEVIVRGTKKLRSIPAAPGIMPNTSQNVLVLDYGTPETLEIIRSRAHELAAVITEPVQSRRPDFRPVEFLKEVRKITEESGTLFIFDEVVTGFRSHPGGAQALFGIKADLCSYGKVVGGGFSIGVIAGKRAYMDALDGGHWEYGDASIPTVGVTYFAGTFVRHPLALATTKAALLHMKEHGPALQERLTAKAAAMAAELNAYFEEVGAPMKINQFASLWRNAFTEDLPYSDLVYAMIRDRGIHILDNFPCFLTTSHSDEDIALIVRAYKEAVAEMQAGGFFPPPRKRPVLSESNVTDISAARSVPSTEPQREIWLATHLGTEASLAFNESVSLHLRGELDVAALRAAVRALPKRHDALRSVFSDDGLTLIVPKEARELEVPLHDLTTHAAKEAELAATIERHVTEPFDLENGPLVRAELVRLTADHHVLVFTGHHIVLDGWSYWVIVKELAALYAQATGSRKAELPIAPSFAEYAVREDARKTTPELVANEQWWVDRFEGGAKPLDLPTDRPRPAMRTQTADRVDHVLPADLLAAVRKAGAKHGASLFATLLAGFNALLHRLSGQTDLVVGVPAAGQNAEGLEGLVGHCVGMLPLRTQLSREQSFAELLGTSKKTVLDAFDHQDVTFGRVLQQLPIARDASRLPLISVVFNIDQALTGEGHAFPGLELVFESNARRFETFELFINAVDCGTAGMRLECQYNRDLFDEATVRRWLASFETMLRAAASDASIAIGKLPILSDGERKQLAAWNATEAAYPRDSRVEQLIAATIKRSPDRVAVQTEQGSLTYGELGKRASEVAARLRARGVGAGDLVGLMVDRDEHLLVSLLGALDAGAGYLPLDPSFPADRLAFMIDDAKVKVVATTESVAARVPLDPARAFFLDRPSQGSADRVGRAPTAEDVAYVIYTSGSTGKPKGVRVPHRSVVNLLSSVAREPGMRDTDVVLAVTTLSFDIAVSELILPLTVGAKIVLASRAAVTDGDKLRALVEQ
ncbi:MAG: aminotransferase class III-fold pyridoxal phosphate-dependent enzyme, partial [Polyangiales bacterium]